MLNNLGDILAKRQIELDIGRSDILIQAQKELDKLYPGRCRALAIRDGVIKIITASASVAGDLRIRQVAFLALIPAATKIHIQIREL